MKACGKNAFSHLCSSFIFALLLRDTKVWEMTILQKKDVVSFVVKAMTLKNGYHYTKFNISQLVIQIKNFQVSTLSVQCM